MEENKNTTNAPKRRGVNLIAKFSLVIVIPMVILAVFILLSVDSVGSTTSERLIEHDLNAASYSLTNMLDSINNQGYTYEDGELLKGAIDLTKKTDIIDNFKDEVEVEVSVYYGDVCGATSMTDANGDRLVGTQADEAIAQKVLAGEKYYATGVKINGQKYYAYYAPLYQYNSDETIGMIFVGMSEATAEGIYKSIVRATTIFLIGMMIVIFLIVVIFLRMIVKQINNMVGNLDQVAEGALDVSVGSKLLERGDEIGNIARSIHALTTGLARIIHNILKTSDDMDTFSVQFQDSFEKISESIANVNVAVEEIANGATSQAGETQNVNERMNEMGVAIEETAQQVVSLREAAKTMQEYNNTVGQTIVELSQISDETRRSVNEVHEQTNTTNRSTQEIRTATEIIADIADQTNLLSLNASIEAARAGEMGKGFAVVADEIRVLADQSRDSAEQISKVVDSLIENSNTSVETMLNLVDVIQKQDEKLSDTRQVFESLNSEITEVGDAIANINARIERIGRSKTVAMGGVESLAAIAQQNAASTQETAASMTELDKIVSECRQATQQLVSMASELKGLTTKFKLGDMQDVHNIVEEIKDSADIVPENELAVE